MLRNFALLVLLGACAYQQRTIREQKALIQDLIGGLQRDAEVMNDTTWEVPPPPNIPRDEAMYALEHPREQ